MAATLLCTSASAPPPLSLFFCKQCCGRAIFDFQETSKESTLGSFSPRTCASASFTMRWRSNPGSDAANSSADAATAHQRVASVASARDREGVPPAAARLPNTGHWRHAHRGAPRARCASVLRCRLRCPRGPAVHPASQSTPAAPPSHRHRRLCPSPSAVGRGAWHSCSCRERRQARPLRPRPDLGLGCAARPRRRPLPRPLASCGAGARSVRGLEGEGVGTDREGQARGDVCQVCRLLPLGKRCEARWQGRREARGDGQPKDHATKSRPKWQGKPRQSKLVDTVVQPTASSQKSDSIQNSNQRKTVALMKLDSSPA